MLGFLIVLFLTLSFTLGVILAFRYVWTSPSNTRNVLIKISLGLFSLVWTLIVLESFFRTFVVYPDGFSYTLASRKWLAEYWRPINSFGFRDIEHDLGSLGSKKVLFVVGDSFVAGQGIENPRDRFSDVLAAQLGDDWEVFNIAKSGWDTKDEFNAIRDFPIIPDMVVLSYFVNDIDRTASRVWRQDQTPFIEQPHWPIRSLVKHSHLFNFFYWRAYRFQNARQMATVYLAYLERAYNDAEVWSVHAQELHRLVDWTENNELDIVAVVFPVLVDLEWSRPFTKKVVHLLQDRGVPVVDLPEKLSGRNPRELVVNQFDAHPSVSLHKEVATLLWAKLGGLNKLIWTSIFFVNAVREI